MDLLKVDTENVLSAGFAYRPARPAFYLWGKMGRNVILTAAA